jgi:hypothetical protein
VRDTRSSRRTARFRSVLLDMSQMYLHYIKYVNTQGVRESNDDEPEF